MNGTGIERYSKNWEKLSRKLRLSHPCFICQETDYYKKECHHIDGDKKNSDIKNVVVLCVACHSLVHDGLQTIINFKGYQISGYSVTVAHDTSSVEDWFNSKQPLKLLPHLQNKIANDFRKHHLKGFLTPGPCNIFIGVQTKAMLFGVLGFVTPDGAYGTAKNEADLTLKADTTPSEFQYSTDLLLYILRTKEVQKILENKFCRKIETAYSMCFSQHEVINRYRKHAELVKKVPTEGGYNLGYIFKLGTVPSLKSAKSLWMQNHKIT